jgi:hypothetical protein
MRCSFFATVVAPVVIWGVAVLPKGLVVVGGVYFPFIFRLVGLAGNFALLRLQDGFPGE